MSTPVFRVRDAAFDRLRINSAFKDFRTLRKVPMPTLSADKLPALSVVVISEGGVADGQGNQGDIRFLNDVVIGFSVARAFADPAYMEGQLDDDVATIKNILLTDASFTRLWQEAFFESIEKVQRRWVFPAEGEAYFAELRLEFTFRYREDFIPVITDELRVIDVTTRFPAGGTEEQIEGTQQVHTRYPRPYPLGPDDIVPIVPHRQTLHPRSKRK